MIPETEPDHESSPTAHLLDEIALYGYRPFSDEADPRPLPDERIAAGAVADITTRPQTLFRGTRLVIPSAIAPNVVIEDIKVGRNSQFAASGGQPGEAFKDTATGDNVSLDTARPGMDVTLKVQNVGATALDFRATLFGDVVE